MSESNETRLLTCHCLNVQLTSMYINENDHSPDLLTMMASIESKNPQVAMLIPNEFVDLIDQRRKNQQKMDRFLLNSNLVKLCPSGIKINYEYLCLKRLIEPDTDLQVVFCAICEQETHAIFISKSSSLTLNYGNHKKKKQQNSDNIPENNSGDNNKQQWPQFALAHKSLLSDDKKIAELRSSRSYSPALEIVLPDHLIDYSDLNEIKKLNFQDSGIGDSSSLMTNTPLYDNPYFLISSYIQTDITEKIRKFLKQEKSSMQDRIRMFSKEQDSMFKDLYQVSVANRQSFLRMIEAIKIRHNIQHDVDDQHHQDSNQLIIGGGANNNDNNNQNEHDDYLTMIDNNKENHHHQHHQYHQHQPQSSLNHQKNDLPHPNNHKKISTDDIGVDISQKLSSMPSATGFIPSIGGGRRQDSLATAEDCLFDIDDVDGGADVNYHHHQPDRQNLIINDCIDDYYRCKHLENIGADVFGSGASTTATAAPIAQEVGKDFDLEVEVATAVDVDDRNNDDDLFLEDEIADDDVDDERRDVFYPLKESNTFSKVLNQHLILGDSDDQSYSSLTSKHRHHYPQQTSIPMNQPRKTSSVLSSSCSMYQLQKIDKIGQQGFYGSVKNDDHNDYIQRGVGTGQQQHQQIANSLPISIPHFGKDFRKMEESFRIEPGESIADSIQKLARSVRNENDILDDRPRRRLNTGDLIKSRPFFN